MESENEASLNPRNTKYENINERNENRAERKMEIGRRPINARTRQKKN